MSQPSGEIVARPLIKRGCGCIQEFQFYAVDRYRAQRMAKFQQTRCPACVAKLQEERRQLCLPPKGEAFKMLPHGTVVSLTLRPNGAWTGTLTADGTSVETTEASAGPQAIVLTLTRLWIARTRPADAKPNKTS
jgi:hypothetical protein